VRGKLLKLLDLSPQDRVWEIGPGLGAMTHMVAGLCRTLTVFEIDHGFIRFLQEAFSGIEGFSIIEGDVIKSWPEVYRSGNTPDRIFGNLPYNCAATFIGDIVESSASPAKMVFTVQKEVAERMAARPGGQQYGAFSLLCTLGWEVSIAGQIKPGAFYPVPEVTSAIVEMVPHNRYPDLPMSLAVIFIRDLFAARRKTVKNCLVRGRIAGKIGPEALLGIASESGIDTSLRAERIDVEAVVRSIYRLTDEFGLHIMD
jgi:16S rRNA (adenine1518-N6/adenine1519-N6)-dimethyltransferase